MSNTGSKTVITFDIVVHQISKILAVIAAVVLLIMMIIICVDVIGRYFFNAPLPGANELAGFLLVVVAVWGMGYCQILHRNIRVDILYVRFKPTSQSVLNIIANTALVVMGAVICWQMSIKTYEYINKPLGLTEILSMPIWPFLLLLALGFGWAVVVYVIELIKSVKEISKR